MENFENRRNATVGLYMVIRELMSAVWVETGDALPNINIMENEKAIEVNRKDALGRIWVMQFRVEDRTFIIEYDLSLMYGSTEGIGDTELSNATNDDLAIAGALVLKYYVQAMSGEHETSAY